MVRAASTAVILLLAAKPAPALESQIVVFVSAKSPLRNVSTDDFKKAFLGESDPSGIKVTIAMPPMESPETASFLKEFLGINREQFDGIWKFRQKNMAKMRPKHMADGNSVRNLVQNYPTTIGVTRATPEDLGEGFAVVWQSGKH